MRIANSGVRDALLAAVAVVPGEHQDDRQADQECEECDLPELCRPVEGLADVLQALQESPGGGDVDKSPLHDLAAAQRGPDVRHVSVWCPVVHFLNSRPSMLVFVQCTRWAPRTERTNQSQTKSLAPFGRHLSGQPRARHSCSSPTALTSRRNPAVWRIGRARSHQMTLSITSVPRSRSWTTRTARSASPRMTLE